ncbi:MAG TPA: hypothetical protein VF169_20620 [Albitalea sp.]|uniref:hypothetical protein n=1 Tax=Piscinibacter sp. TaxID=1903157 RepID=UPI002ED1076E
MPFAEGCLMDAESRTTWIDRFVHRMCALGTSCARKVIAEKAADLWETCGHTDPIEVADATWPGGLPHAR